MRQRGRSAEISLRRGETVLTADSNVLSVAFSFGN